MRHVIGMLLASLVTLTTADAQACNCPRLNAPCAGYWTAAAVFVGRVDVVTRAPANRTVTLTVLEGFRGVSSNTLDVVTGAASPRCGIPFRIDARLYDNGRVAGRVLDSSGRPVAGLTIELTAGNGIEGKRTLTDRDGRYEVARVPPGRFVISVNTGSHRTSTLRQPRVFYPGVEKLAGATRVTVGAGERVRLDDFRIPAHLKYVAVSGFVFDADGMPADGARVYLKGVGEGDVILSEPAIADSTGRFVIAALGGADYQLFAERAGSGSRRHRVDSTDQRRLTVVEGLKPLRLMLQRRY